MHHRVHLGFNSLLYPLNPPMPLFEVINNIYDSSQTDGVQFSDALLRFFHRAMVPLYKTQAIRGLYPYTSPSYQKLFPGAQLP